MAIQPYELSIPGNTDSTKFACIVDTVTDRVFPLQLFPSFDAADKFIDFVQQDRPGVRFNARTQRELEHLQSVFLRPELKHCNGADLDSNCCAHAGEAKLYEVKMGLYEKETISILCEVCAAAIEKRRDAGMLAATDDGDIWIEPVDMG